jgi:predicted molibdopterin-dependent oxidoreductase YjgC
MLEQPADTVVLLPARTRYEQRDGGTETSTERRVYFSPEIPGHRVGEARSEWEILMELAERVYPDRRGQIHFGSGAEIREEIARAIPAYAGIERLRRKGDAFQWGGRLLCEDGAFPTVDGKALFMPLSPPELALPEGWFLCSSRRGRQFNSMVQGQRDPLVGADRDSVLMSREDARVLGIGEGDPVVLVSNAGEMRYWPEGNVLLRRGATDPVCGIPDYNTLVQIRPVKA